jgi:hypothetical protein
MAARNSGPAGGCAINKMLFAPLRSGTTHIMIFWPVSLRWPVPGWTEKRHQRGDRAAEKNADRNPGTFSMRPGKPVADRSICPVDEIRSIITVVDQIAAFFIACKNLRHLPTPPSVRITSRWSEHAHESIGNRDGLPLSCIGALLWAEPEQSGVTRSRPLYLSYATQRRSISHSYGIVGTSCAVRFVMRPPWPSLSANPR